MKLALYHVLLPFSRPLQGAAADRQVLDSLPVEVLSRGWMPAAYLKNSRLEALDPKVLRDGCRREGRLYASPGQLHAGGIDSALLNWKEFSNVCAFGVDGDNFTLKTRFRNSPAEGALPASKAGCGNATGSGSSSTSPAAPGGPPCSSADRTARQVQRPVALLHGRIRLAGGPAGSKAAAGPCAARRQAGLPSGLPTARRRHPRHRLQLPRGWLGRLHPLV